MTPIAWAALLLFLGIYVAISLEAAHKTIVALVGAALFLLIGVLDATEAFAFIDWHVIFLLVSMMVIVNIARHTGMFQWVAIRTAKLARGEPVAILVLLSVVTAFISAFLDNVTTILITAPVTILIAVELGRLARALPGVRRDRLEHRRHRDPHRRPAEHHDRQRRRPRASSISSRTSRP